MMNAIMRMTMTMTVPHYLAFHAQSDDDDDNDDDGDDFVDNDDDNSAVPCIPCSFR